MGKQYVLLVATRAMSAVLFAIQLALVARSSTIAEFGVLGVGMSIAMFTNSMTDLGLPSFLARERARGRQDRVSAGLRLSRSTSGILLLVALTGCAVLMARGLTPWPLTLLAVSTCLDRHTDATVSTSLADRRVWVVPSSLLLRRVSTLVVYGALTVFTETPAVSSLCLSLTVAGVIGVMHAEAWSYRHCARVDSGHVPLARELWPFAVASMTTAVRTLDTAVVGLVAGSIQGGLYSAAARLLNPLWLLSGSLTQILVPASARGAPEGGLRFARKIVALHCALAVCCVLLAVVSAPLVEMVFGSEYRAAAPILAVGLLAFPFVALSSSLAAILQGLQQERFVATNGGLFAVILLPATALGAHLGDGVGVAISIGIVYTAKALVLIGRSCARPASSVENLPQCPTTLTRPRIRE